MNRHARLAVGAWLLCSAPAVLAADLTLLSAGAVEPGLRPVLAAFEQSSGHRVALTFATAPQIRERVESGASFDVLIAPPAVLDALAKASKLASDPAQRVSLGRVGIGVAVRPGAALPDISTAEAVKRALLEADSVVYNRASTGLFFETQVKKMGLEAQLASKTTRHPDGASVMQHVLMGQGREIGFGATTEILLLRERGLQFVGPMPAELQNFTTYIATQTTGAARPDAAQALLRHLASPESKAGFTAAGIEAVP